MIPTSDRLVLGIDIGGTGIKGGIVNLESGELQSQRVRLPTPQPATPTQVADVVMELQNQLSWNGPVGCGFPSILRKGVVHLASNISAEWIGVDVSATFSKATGCQVSVINDADAAGLAEMRFGAGRGRLGVVLLVTLGTGIGSALFVDGLLVPNTEFGHIEINGRNAESWAASVVREREGLSWKKWGKRVDSVLRRMQLYLSPDLIIVGGGISKNHEKFLPFLTVDTEVVPAELRNEAGIVGAATSTKLA
jgi:polyphosphate glucokinase